MSTLILETQIYFSYSQFVVYDEDFVKLTGLKLTDAHYNQGFARSNSVVVFFMLAQFGLAQLRVYESEFRPHPDYCRVVAVPFNSSTGTVNIEGPDEARIGRRISLAAGSYRLTTAQHVVQYAEFDDEEDAIAIDLFFEALESPINASEIILKDADLDPPDPLSEVSDITIW